MMTLVDRDASLDGSEKEALKRDIDDIARNEDQAETKAARVKNLVGKAAPEVGKAALDLAVAVGSEVLLRVLYPTVPR